MTTKLLAYEAEALVAKARGTLQTLQTLQTQPITEKDGLPKMEATTTSTPAPAATASATITPAQVAALYIGGSSIVEVASALGITYGRARKLLTESGTPLRDSSDRLKGRTRPIKATA